MLFVSHNMAAVKQLCDRCVWLDNGTVRMIGSTDVVVGAYLGDSDESVSDVTFQPGQSGRVVFHRAWIGNANGTSVSEVDAMEPFQVHLDIEVREPVGDVDISVWLATVRETPVFHASLSRSNEGKPVALKPGRYACALHVPGHCLVPDVYKVSIEAHVPEVVTESIHWRALRFAVIETGSRMRLYKDAWRFGCVMDNCDWQLQEAVSSEALPE